MTDIDEIKDVLTDISCAVDGLVTEQKRQKEEISRLKKGEVQPTALPVCPACGKEYGSDWMLLQHVFKSHKGWIRLEDPALDEQQEQQGATDQPGVKRVSVLRDMWNRNKVTVILVLVSLVMLGIAAIGML